MAQVEEKFRDLLHPIKDLEKCFQIDIAFLLKAYIENFVQGRAPPNFNSAALLLQGSSSIYGKKVEYIHNLATQLYDSLIRHTKVVDGAKKETNKKERQKDKKFDTPFFSTEIKKGKNLSFLRKKAVIKAPSAKNKKKIRKPMFVPVDLLPFDGEEKGDVYYDTQNEAIGNKTDFAINKCRLIISGWLLIPTVHEDQVPLPDSPPDYPIYRPPPDDYPDDNAVLVPANNNTPDEGVCMETQTPSDAHNSPDVPMSQNTDEGMGSMTSTPMECQSQQSSELTPSQQSSEPTSSQLSSQQSSEPTLSQQSSAPTLSQQNGVVESEADGLDEIMDDLPVEDQDTPELSLRRSMRQSQKSQVIDENQVSKEDEIVAVKKAIQKKNTFSLPLKLKSRKKKKKELIAEFCSRTFFAHMAAKGKTIDLGTLSFNNNAKLHQNLDEQADKIKAGNKKNKKTEEDDEDEFVDVETLKEPDPDDLVGHCNIEADDIVIHNDPDELPFPDGIPTGDLSPNGERLTNGTNGLSDLSLEDEDEERELISRDIKRFEKNAESTRRVKEWGKKLEPFLAELEQREAFDINLYGSRILNTFDAPTQYKQRRQTKTFREFCQGMEKWQIHRYFMALLPLANIGNVLLEIEKNEDQEEEILITLLTRRMHHLALEEFNNSGTSH